jgi:hypothetical protein
MWCGLARPGARTVALPAGAVLERLGRDASLLIIGNRRKKHPLKAPFTVSCKVAAKTCRTNHRVTQFGEGEMLHTVSGMMFP